MRKVATIIAVIAIVGAVLTTALWLRARRESTKTAGEVTRYAPGDFQSAIIAAAMTPPGVTTAVLADERSLAGYGVLANLGFEVATNRLAAAGLMVTGSFPESAADGIGTLAILADVRGMSVGEFARHLARISEGRDVRLWAPTAADWLIVVSERGAKIRLERIFELFCREAAFVDQAEASANRASDIFASYVGSYEDIKAAFEGEDLSPQVRLEFLLTREIPSLEWLDRTGIDDEVYAAFAADARTAQVIRRLICEGEIKGEGGDAEGAMDCWRRAYLRNPSDTLLGERIETLQRNAELLVSLGNYGGAAKCLETLIVINPKNVTNIERYARMLRQLGKLELAQQVAKRAEELKSRKE